MNAQSTTKCPASLALFLLILLVASSTVAQSGRHYVYDETGQLTQVIDPDGTVIEYVYDPAGNIVEVRSRRAGPLAIFAFAPRQGSAGTVVTVQGRGFSSVVAENAVTIGGTAATVQSATPARLELVVPSDVVSGPIAVTVDGTTVTSSEDFTVVRRPRILALTPAWVASDESGPTSVDGLVVDGENLDGATFEFLPALVPPAVTVASSSITPDGLQATLDLTLADDAAGAFVLVATNGAGASESIAHSANQLIVLRGSGDEDGDGLSNAQELALGTDPFRGDSDGDGFGDPDEVDAGSSPIDGTSLPVDPQGSYGLAASATFGLLNGTVPPVPTFARETATVIVALLNSSAPPEPSDEQQTSTQTFSLLNDAAPPEPDDVRHAEGGLFTLLNSLAPAASTPLGEAFVEPFSVLNDRAPADPGTPLEAFKFPFSIVNTTAPPEPGFDREALVVPFSVENQP